MKFTERGAVRFSVSRPDADVDLSSIGLGEMEHDKTIAFSVSDSGIGMTEEELSLIFDTFWQSKQNRAREYGGTGLGLPISRVLAQLLKGDIIAASRIGRGSEFTLYLPEMLHMDKEVKKTLLEGEVPDTESAFEETLAIVLRDKKVLIVDDDMRNVYSLMSYLENYHMELFVASTGEKCMELLTKTSDIDLVILDIVLPEMDGYEVLDKIRQMPDYEKLPVLVFSARAMKGERENCISRGASGYISKPVDIYKLMDHIRQLLT